MEYDVAAFFSLLHEQAGLVGLTEVELAGEHLLQGAVRSESLDAHLV